MDKAKGFFDKIIGADAKRQGDGGGMSENKKRFGRGITNTKSGALSGPSNSTPGYLGPWGEDRMTTVAICIRGAQVLFVFCMLITIIVLATFQKKWLAAMSGLTGLLLTFTVLTFVFSIFLLALSFPPGALQNAADRVIMLFEQPRLGLVMNGVGLLIWFILSITQTASALSSAACKDPSTDPHAKSSTGNNDDYVKSLPSFCSSKKAGAAFCWLIFLTCVATMLLFLRFWRLSRKNGPRIPPFIHPTDDGDFQPIADDADGDFEGGHDYGRADVPYNPPSGRYGEGGDGRSEAYEAVVHQPSFSNNQSYSPGYTRQDPFADSTYIPRQSYDYGAYGGAQTPLDPYSAIQQQLRSDRAPQLPPLYQG